jgi:hypothetical protein
VGWEVGSCGGEPGLVAAEEEEFATDDKVAIMDPEFSIINIALTWI